MAPLPDVEVISSLLLANASSVTVSIGPLHSPCRLQNSWLWAVVTEAGSSQLMVGLASLPSRRRWQTTSPFWSVIQMLEMKCPAPCGCRLPGSVEPLLPRTTTLATRLPAIFMKGSCFFGVDAIS